MDLDLNCSLLAVFMKVNSKKINLMAKDPFTML
jgi:hypothetical protein